ncbi:L-fucose/L-arabinose isomerase family protein [Chloroflexota bacterium]
MKALKIGFVPAHREPFDEDWAVEMRCRCLDAFPHSSQLEIIVPDEKLTIGGCVRDDGEAEKVIALFNGKDIDGLIIGTMTFGDEVSALTVASAFRDKPVLLFGTKEGSFTPDGNRRSDSFCGTLSISSGLHRRQIPFIFGGIVFPEEENFKEKVRDFLRVCAISRGFIGAKIGLVGPRPERFETCIFSEDMLMRKFSQRVIPVDLADIMSIANSQKGSPAVKKIVKNIKDQADSSAVEAVTLQNIAGLEYALEQFAVEKGLSAIGVQCWTAMQSVYGISPCYAMGCLTDKGIMTSCEVDIYGALTMLLQYLAALGETVPHFIDWTIRHQEKANVFLAWHCGNAPPSLACREGDVSLSYHSILGPSLGIDRSMGTAEFQLAPGAVTLSRLQEHDGKFKMLISEGKIVASQQELRGSWSWVEVPDLDKLYAILVKEGFVHHASLIHGDCSRSMVSACELLGIEAIVI